MASLTITTSKWASFLTEGKTYPIISVENKKWVITDNDGDREHMSEREMNRGDFVLDVEFMVKVPKSMLARAKEIAGCE